MVQVYLPLGYPQISGVGFTNIVYQGNLVRLYTVPTDPRSDAQIENRLLLSDVSKMRASLGPWARGAFKAALGSRWATLFWQIVKTDIEGWWSSALAEWDDVSEVNQNAWRNAAPYQATYNDVGAIYFSMVRVAAQALLHYSGLNWQAELWTQLQSAQATTWWTRAIASYTMTAGSYYHASPYIESSAGWSVLTDPNPPNWEYLKATAAGEVVGGYVYGKQVVYAYKLLGDYGSVDFYVDGQQVFFYQLLNYNNLYAWVLPYKGLHHFEIRVNTPNVTFEYFEVD